MSTLTEKEMAEVRRICDEKNVQASAVETDVVEAIERADTSVGGLAEWLEKMRAEGKRKHLFVDLTMVDLESRAFGEHGPSNISARGQLVKAIGESAAEARARDWGLRGLHDYKTHGTRRGNANNKQFGKMRRTLGAEPDGMSRGRVNSIEQILKPPPRLPPPPPASSARPSPAHNGRTTWQARAHFFSPDMMDDRRAGQIKRHITLPLASLAGWSNAPRPATSLAHQGRARMSVITIFCFMAA